MEWRTVYRVRWEVKMGINQCSGLYVKSVGKKLLNVSCSMLIGGWPTSGSVEHMWLMGVWFVEVCNSYWKCRNGNGCEKVACLKVEFVWGFVCKVHGLYFCYAVPVCWINYDFESYNLTSFSVGSGKAYTVTYCAILSVSPILYWQRERALAIPNR